MSQLQLLSWRVAPMAKMRETCTPTSRTATRNRPASSAKSWTTPTTCRKRLAESTRIPWTKKRLRLTLLLFTKIKRRSPSIRREPELTREHLALILRSPLQLSRSTMCHTAPRLSAMATTTASRHRLQTSTISRNSRLMSSGWRAKSLRPETLCQTRCLSTRWSPTRTTTCTTVSREATSIWDSTPTRTVKLPLLKSTPPWTKISLREINCFHTVKSVASRRPCCPCNQTKPLDSCKHRWNRGKSSPVTKANSSGTLPSTTYEHHDLKTSTKNIAQFV